MAAWDWLNITEPNKTSILGLVQYDNNVTGGMFGIGISIAIFIVSFISMKRYGNASAITGSGFISAMLAVLLRVINLVPDGIVWIFMIITLVGLIFLFKERDMETG